MYVLKLKFYVIIEGRDRERERERDRERERERDRERERERDRERERERENNLISRLVSFSVSREAQLLVSVSSRFEKPLSRSWLLILNPYPKSFA